MKTADKPIVKNRPDYILDLSSPEAPPLLGDMPVQADASQVGTDKQDGGNPWIAIHWRCCHTYSRIYRNHAQTAYEGRCPSCGQFAMARIGAGGTRSRFFAAE